MAESSSLSEKVPPSPIGRLFERISSCAVYVAPERETELRAALGGRAVHCVVDVEDGRSGITVDPETCEIALPLAQLERLWAMTYGFLTAYREGRKYYPAEITTVQEAPELQQPLQLLSWACDGIRAGKRLDWPDGLPRPDVPGDDPEHVENINRFFLGALGFILLHEIAHHVLKHPSPKFQSENDSIRCELEADRWAGDWIFEKCPNNEGDRLFRGNCSVLALSIINLVEAHLRPSASPKTHPPVIERILDLITRHIPESVGQRAVSTDFPIYLAAVILHVQRINLGIDPGLGTERDSITDYLVEALRAFQNDR
jgi:Peptidase U49